MGLFGLVFMIAGFIGTVIGYIRIAIYAYREQGPPWGLLCLLVPNANLIWGIIHWADNEARQVFVRYLGCIGLWLFGMLLMKWAAA